MVTGPVIEPTDEMERAYKQASRAVKDAAQVMNCSEHGMGDCPYHQVPGAARRAGLAAVFAVLARDYTITPKQAACHAQAGDILVIGFTQRLSSEAADRITGHLREQIDPAVRVAVVDGVSGMAVVKGAPVAAAPQCPACTSPYTYHRFALPNPDGDGPAYCDHEWHDADAVTSGTCQPGDTVKAGDCTPIDRPFFERVAEVRTLVEDANAGPRLVDDNHYDTACDDRPDCTIAEHHSKDGA